MSTRAPSTVERYLVVRCPDLAYDGALGREARTFTEVVGAAGEFCPVVETVAPGICALVTRGPARYFGGEAALAARVCDRVVRVPGAGRIWVGIADGLFAAVVAARAGIIVPAGGTAAFLGSLPVTVLGRDDEASLLIRLGIRTLGDFAALPPDAVLARFGSGTGACHRVARGEESELPGMRAAYGTRAGPPAGDGTTFRQHDFWGGKSAAEERAACAVAAVQEIAGPESVFVAVRRGGRSLRAQSALMLWGKKDERGTVAGAVGAVPWPGAVPPPLPALAYRRLRRAELAGADGVPVAMDARLALSAAPARFSLDGGPWQPVSSWAGPWTEDMAWWTRRRRRRARIQVCTPEGSAHLFVCESGRWALEATYD